MKAKLGSGVRFATLKASLSKKSTVSDPGALAASIGRKKLGFVNFQALARRGKMRAPG